MEDMIYYRGKLVARIVALSICVTLGMILGFVVGGNSGGFECGLGFSLLLCFLGIQFIPGHLRDVLVDVLSGVWDWGIGFFAGVFEAAPVLAVICVIPFAVCLVISVVVLCLNVLLFVPSTIYYLIRYLCEKEDKQ